MLSSLLSLNARAVVNGDSVKPSDALPNARPSLSVKVGLNELTGVAEAVRLSAAVALANVTRVGFADALTVRFTGAVA